MFAGHLKSQFNLTLARQRMLILPLNTNPLSEILTPDPFEQIPLPLSRKVPGSGLGGSTVIAIWLWLNISVAAAGWTLAFTFT